MKKSRIKRVNNYLSSPFVLAIPIALVIIFLLPDSYNRYELSVIKTETEYKQNAIEKYVDFDFDGADEKVVCFYNKRGFAAVQVLDSDNILVDQWNFCGKYSKEGTLFHACDFDHDGLAELYLLTCRNDSIMLNVINPLQDGEVIMDDKFICKTSKYHGEVDYKVANMNNIDLDGDGYDEILMMIKAGFTGRPRGIFAYNYVTDTVIRTPELGASLLRILPVDLNNDQKPEIFCGGSTRGNIHDSLGIPYNDYSSWMMAFDHNLQFLFPPMDIAAYPSEIRIGVINIKGEECIVALFADKSKPDYSGTLKIIDENGKIVHEQLLTDQNGLPLLNCSLLCEIPNNRILVRSGESFCILNEHLEIQNCIAFDANYTFSGSMDVNDDDKYELIFFNSSGLLITDHALQYPVKLDLNINRYIPYPLIISVRSNGPEPSELIAKVGSQIFFLSYKSNFLYYFRYVFWLAIYIGLVFLVYFVGYLQTRQIRKKMRTQELINSLKIKGLKNYISPHFMYNAINSISALAVSGDTKKLHYFSSRLTSLTRKLLEDSDKIDISLQDEIDFTMDYLELQKMRFEGEFNYHINIDDGVDMSAPIPRTIIHTFVENAIKHGLRGLDHKGLINIDVYKENSKLFIKIADNGNGFKEHKSYKSTGQGFKIIERILELYQDLHGGSTNWHIEEGDTAGVSVLIEITQ